MKLNMSKWWIGFFSFIWGMYAAMGIETLVGNYTWTFLDSFLSMLFFIVCVVNLAKGIEFEESET